MLKKFSEGAEATIYLARLYGKDVLIKHREPKRYRVRELDESIRIARTKKEAKMTVKAHENGVSVPQVVAVGSSAIYMEHLHGKLLKDTRITKDAARLVGKQLAILHNSGIVHGDFTPANIITDGKKIYVIDFGLSEPSSASEERALDLLLMKRQMTKALYSAFASSYSRNAKSSKETLSRLEAIEERGRYQTRTLA